MKTELTDRHLGRKAVTTLQALGNFISVARRARDIKQSDLAGMSSIGLNTMVSIEKGAASVKMGHYVMVLDALGLLDILDQAISTHHDPVAVAGMVELLPRRVG